MALSLLLGCRKSMGRGITSAVILWLHVLHTSLGQRDHNLPTSGVRGSLLQLEPINWDVSPIKELKDLKNETKLLKTYLCFPHISWTLLDTSPPQS